MFMAYNCIIVCISHCRSLPAAKAQSLVEGLAELRDGGDSRVLGNVRLVAVGVLGGGATRSGVRSDLFFLVCFEVDGGVCHWGQTEVVQLHGIQLGRTWEGCSAIGWRPRRFSEAAFSEALSRLFLFR